MSIPPSLGHPEWGPDDRVLLQRLRAGDRAALDEIVETYWMPLVTYAQSFLHASDPAEDVAQETFVRLWDGRRRWDTSGAVNALVYRIARNLAIDVKRRSKVRLVWRSTEQASAASRTPDPAEAAEENELREAVNRAVESLSPRRREIFTLVRFHNLSYREIADVLDLAEQTVANHMSAALADLRRALQAFLTD